MAARKRAVILECLAACKRVVILASLAARKRAVILEGCSPGSCCYLTKVVILNLIQDLPFVLFVVCLSVIKYKIILESLAARRVPGSLPSLLWPLPFLFVLFLGRQNIKGL